MSDAFLLSLVVGTLAVPARFALADEGTPPGTVKPTTSADLVLGGYVESFYQWNFNDPSNAVTNFRGFDTRHNSFTLSNVVLDAAATAGAASVRLALQFGHTPETYYLAEPSSPGAGGSGSTGSATWKFLQQANVGYRTSVGRGLLVEGGIFLSPIGPEGIAVKDQWNWSRSNLFFGLPFYHTGARATYPISDRTTVALMVCNGWNSVVDNNKEKSLSTEATYVMADRLTAHALYFTGVERPEGAPEGEPMRHLFDAYVTWYATPGLSLNLHGDAGFEDNAFGTSSWSAEALSVRLRAASWMYLAGRGDIFHEEVAENETGSASPIFWPASRVASGTFTMDMRPGDNVSVRLEYRHDDADDPMFFRDTVTTDTDGVSLVNSRKQDTLTLGMVVWL